MSSISIYCWKIKLVSKECCRKKNEVEENKRMSDNKRKANKMKLLNELLFIFCKSAQQSLLMFSIEAEYILLILSVTVMD